MKMKRELKSKNITVKKHKGTMKTFNEMNAKRYQHHCDHSYAKNIIIDRVNDDCLAEIFTYVRTCEKPKIALVCKKWKRALDDSWFNVKKLELIYWRYYDEDINCLNKYPTIDGKFNFLKLLLHKCGRYLTRLDLTAYGHCNIVPLINNYCPKLRKLRLRFISIDDSMLLNAFTRLSKLLSLTIIFENMKGKIIPVNLINSLINVAKTLLELNLFHYIDHFDDICDFPKEIDSVICQLKVMAIFTTAGIRMTSNLIKKTSGISPFSYSNNHIYFPRLIDKPYPFIHIKALDIMKFNVTNESLYFIANTMKNLQTLAVSCQLVNNVGVVAISKMINLQYLLFYGRRDSITGSSIKLLKNMVEIYLPHSNKITEFSLIKLLENSPGMNKIRLYNISVTTEFVKKAAEISRNRKRLLTLIVVLFVPDIKQYESEYLKISFVMPKENK